MLYPWHPWFGKPVRVHRSVSRRDRVAFQCTLVGEDRPRTLEVPQWMLDRASCCVMQLAAAPRVDSLHLRSLVQLLRLAADEDRDLGSQTDQSPSPTGKGETDEPDPETPSSDSTETVPPAADDPSVEGVARPCQAEGQGPLDSPASRAPCSTPRGQETTGGKR